MLLLDHIFILSSPGAPEADALLNLGLVEGPARAHPGEGSSNRLFFLANTKLEFLFIQDISEAVNGPGKGLKLVERAIDTNASPFGLVTRWRSEKPTPDYPFWEYQPDYFPEPMCFYVGKNSDNFDEPLCICMPPALPAPSAPPTPNNSDWFLTELELCIPAEYASETLTRYAQCDEVNIKLGEEHRLKLVFNRAEQGQRIDFMPDLPFSIEW